MKNNRQLIRTIFFLFFGIMCFFLVQFVLSKKWYGSVEIPPFKDTFDEFYDLSSETDIQVLFLGSSHVYNGIDVMQIYKDSGITSFNLATSSQPIEVSQYIIEEAFRVSHPHYVFLDVSTIFHEESFSPQYRYVIDNMKFGLPKISLAYSYAIEFGENRKLGTFISCFFPIYEYHDRWKSLKGFDFVYDTKKNLFLKGSCPITFINPASLDTLMMNDDNRKIMDEKEWLYENTGENEKITKIINNKIENTISKKNLDILLKILKLCRENKSNLILFKIPSINFPQYYEGAWTKEKSDTIKKLCHYYKITYYDLLYDTNIGLDWSLDTSDGGKHLNIYGAKKITKYLTNILLDKYKLQSKQNKRYDDDLFIYDDLCKIIELRKEQYLNNYLDSLIKIKDLVVLFSASQDMSYSLGEEDIASLYKIGLTTDFSNMSFGDSFLAVIDDKKIVYESTSNKQIEVEGLKYNGDFFYLFSGGWLSGMGSSIKINDEEYSLGNRGINIVVYDKGTHSVIDSVNFDTWNANNQSAIRINNLYPRYVEQKMKEYYKQGIH